jgi:hypothetical protein
MKKIIFLLLAVFGFLSSNLSSQTCTNNLLQNPGFENSLSNWDGLGEIATTGVNSGTKALKICQSGQTLRQTRTTSAGKSYTLNGFAKKDAGATMLVSMKFLNSSFTPLVFEYSNSAVSNTWSALTPIVMTAPTGAAYVEISVLHNGGTGCVYADDLCFFEGNTGNPCNPDITAPTFQNCPANISLTTTGTSANATWVAPTVIDVCTATVAVNSNYVSGASFPIGDRTVIYTASDNANNTSSCNFTVNVTNGTGGPCANDVVPPVFNTCPANITLETPNATANAVWTYPNVTDNCTITPTVTFNYAISSDLPIGVTTVRYTATDEANNTSTCTFTVTVRAQNGFFTCPSNLIINDGFEQGSINPFNGSSTGTLESTTPITGLYSMRVTNTSTVSPAGGIINFPAGTKLSNLSFKHLDFASSGQQIRVQVDYFKNLSSISAGSENFTLNKSIGAVKIENLTLTGGTDASFAVLKFYTLDNGAMLIDDICITGTVPPTTGCSGNILTDPSFEANSNSWQPSTNITLTNDAATGTKAIQLCNQQVYYQTKAMTAGKNMTLQFKAKQVVAGAKVLAYIKYMNVSFTPLVTEFFSYTCTASYETVAFSKQSPPNTAWVEVGFRNENTTFCALVNDVCLGDGSVVGTNCSISNVISSNIICQDNGTPNIATDDTYSFSMTISNTATCGTGWTGGIAPYTSGSYGVTYGMGNYPISGGNTVLTIRDNANPSVTTTVTAVAPPTCSANVSPKPDLQLSLTATPQSPGQWKNTIFTLTLKNTGTVPAINVAVDFINQSNVQVSNMLAYISHVAPASTNFNSWTGFWNVGNVAAGQTLVLTYTGFTKVATQIPVFAQVKMASPADADSTPGNNTTGNPTEDDEAKVVINVNFLAPGERQEDEEKTFFEKMSFLEDYTLFPNPAGESVSILLSEKATQSHPATQTTLTFLNQLGKPVYQKTFDATAQVDRVLQVDLSDFSNGIYLVKIETEGQRAVVKRLIVSRMY